jgi:hypothetical protein
MTSCSWLTLAADGTGLVTGRGAAVVDTSTYRGYLIQLATDASLWSFSAQPATPELPILPRVIYRPCASREAAHAEAKKCIDYLLAI